MYFAGIAPNDFALPFYLMVDDGLYTIEMNDTFTFRFQMYKNSILYKTNVHANVNEEAFSKL